MSGPFTGLELGLLALSIEFALLTFATAWLALRGSRARVRSAEAGASALVERVAVSETSRREALATIIRETYRFDEGEAEAVVADFIERERAFYNALIGVHLGRGGKTLADVPGELTRVIAPWLKLTPRNMVAAEAVAELEQTNQALTQELGQTQRVLDELMTEYKAAFMKDSTAPPRAIASPADASQELLSMDEALPADEGVGSPAAPGAARPAVAAEDSPTGEPTIADEPPATAADPAVAADRAVIDTVGEPGGQADGAGPAAAASAEADVVVEDLAEDELAAEPADEWDFEPSGEVIALDRDLDLDEPSVDDAFEDRSPMTPGDLDALMDGLDLEAPRAGAAR